MVKIIGPSFEIERVDGIAMLKRIEAAGRTCYKSEGLITGDSYKAFIRKLIKSGHESVLEHEKVSVRVICDRGCCYTADTKVLTENGFKFFHEVSDGERVYTLNNRNKLILTTPSTKIAQHYTGQIYNFRSTKLDLSVTPNHNMWVFDYNKRKASTRRWKFICAGDQK